MSDMKPDRWGRWLWTVEPTPTWGRIVAWIFTVALALQFFVVGGTKVAAAEMQIENFVRWQLPLWFMPVVGLVEVLAGALLLVPRTRAWGAAVVADTMFVAIFVNLRVMEYTEAMAPAMLMVWALVLLWFNRPQALRRAAADT